MKLKHDKIAEVKIRTEAHNALTTLQKIHKAHSRRGNSLKEVARLTAQLEAEKEAVKNYVPKKK